MIYKIYGKLSKLEENKVVLEVGGIFYEIHIPKTVYVLLKDKKKEVDFVSLIIHHYFNIDKNRGVPVLIGFNEELEKDFFESFIKVSGIGPKAALRALDRPISDIALAIEEGNLCFLKTLAGIGALRAKQIVAQLQGKVGRFALIKKDVDLTPPAKVEIVEEAKHILKRLQYSAKEIDEMLKKAQDSKLKIETVEELLNEIYRQRK